MKHLTIILGVLVVAFGCKVIEPVVEEDRKKKKYVAISENDVMQSLAFGQVTNDKDVFTGKLQNGLTYYILPNSKPENRAELRLVVKAGSIDEDSDQLGLAHFIEHMAFNGTRNFKKNELVDYLESVGSKFGPDLNAYTSFDETVYMLQVRTDDAEQLRKGMMVLSDWASGLSFDPEEVEKERGVVVSEWRSGLSPARRMQNEYLPVLLKGSRYAERLPIGDPEIVQNASLETIKRFYYNWYRPDLMAVVIVGDVNINLIEDDINTFFGGMPKAINPRRQMEYRIPTHEQTLVKVCSDKEAPFTQVQVVHKMPEFKMRDVGDFIERMKASLVTSMINERLVELTKKAEAPLIYGSSSKGRYIGPMDAFTLFGMTPEGGALTGLEAILKEVERAKKFGFLETELQRAKQKILVDAERVIKEADKTESSKLAGRLVNHFLTNEPYPSARGYYELVTKYVPNIRLNEVNALPGYWAKEENRVVIITGPEKEGKELPQVRQIRETLAKSMDEDLEAYTEEIDDRPLVSLPLSEARIERMVNDSATGVESWTLENGARLHFKTTDFNNDQIVFQALAKGGHSFFPDESYFSAVMSGEVVRESGLGGFDALSLSKKLAAKRVSVSAFIRDYSHGIKGESTVKDVDALADLIYLHFEDIREDSIAFEAYRNRMIGIYANLKADPRYYFGNEIQRVIYNDHPRRKFPSKEDIESLDLGMALKAFDQLFDAASDFDFVFVGNLTETEKRLLASRIGQIKGDGTSVERMDLGIDLPSSMDTSWNRGAAPKTYVHLAFSGMRPDEINSEMGLRGYRDILNIKLRERLREDKGGVYGVRVGLGLPKRPEPRYDLSISFNTDPGLADSLIGEVRDVMFKLLNEGPSESDLNKVKEIKRQEYIKGFQENGFWLSQVSRALEEGEPLENINMAYKESLLGMITYENVLKWAQEIDNEARKVVLVQHPE
jgi:zinc protease